MKPITLVVRYYNQPLMLRHHLAAMSGLPDDVRAHLHVVLVDDGSNAAPAAAEVLERGAPDIASFRIFRTKVDVMWNQEFAANLGAAQIDTEWFLNLDIDHEVPAKTLRALMTGAFDPANIYLLPRTVAGSGLELVAAPGLWFLTRALFDRIGGLDERFAGRYLPSDRDFMQRAERRGGACVAWLEDRLIVHDEDVGLMIPDASSVRSMPHVMPPEAEATYARIIEERGERAPVRLSFPWERVL